MSQVDMVIREISKTDLDGATAWDLFQVRIEALLIAVKYEPGRAADARNALHALMQRVYDDFIAQRVTHDDIRNFLLPMRARFIQILPRGQGGADLMEQVVTALTMSSTDQAGYNEWGTEIVVAANA